MTAISNATQHGKILEWMKAQPTRNWKVSDFQRSPYFIGYEAWSRISDLVRFGEVEKVGYEWRFAIYRVKSDANKQLSLPS